MNVELSFSNIMSLITLVISIGGFVGVLFWLKGVIIDIKDSITINKAKLVSNSEKIEQVQKAHIKMDIKCDNVENQYQRIEREITAIHTKLSQNDAKLNKIINITTALLQKQGNQIKITQI